MTVHVADMHFAFNVVFMQQGVADKRKREMAMDDADRWHWHQNTEDNKQIGKGAPECNVHLKLGSMYLADGAYNMLYLPMPSA